MKAKLLYRAVSMTMVVILPSTLTMADGNAMLYASGSVTINGTRVPGSSAIFAGDKIQTLKHATAVISNSNSTVSLPAESSVVIEDNSVELSQGSAVIVTKKKTTGHLAGLSISPVAANATKFELIDQTGTERIAALHGSLRVTDGRHTIELLPGQALTRNAVSIARLDASSASEQGGGAPPAAGGGSGGGIPGWAIGLAATGAAAGAVVVGLKLAGTFDQGKVSPSKP